MRHLHIAVLVGSLRKDSFNRRLAEGLARLAPTHVSLVQQAIATLPLYNQDDDGDQPVAVREFKAAIGAADGVLFATPEYNRSIPGVLKNALDHGSRPYGQNVWAKKPAGIIGVSIGANGTAMAQQHLRNVLAYLDMPTLNQPEAFLQMRDGLFDDDGNIGAASLPLLQGWIDAFVEWAEHVAPRATAEAA